MLALALTRAAGNTVKHFGIDAITLEELILTALENKGRIPAGVRKRYKAKMPEGLVEAIEAEVRGRLSREREDLGRETENPCA